MIDFMQGDSLPLDVDITDESGNDVPIDQIDKVEFMVGSVRKVYPDDAVFDDEKKCFTMTLSQADTLSLAAGRQIAQIRVKTVDGLVIGWQACCVVNVRKSNSNEVI